MTRILLGLCCTVLCLGVAQAAQVTLCTDEQTAYTIMVDPDATAAEKHAADELSRFLKQVTGAAFPVKTGTRAGFDPLILVGPGTAARALAPNVDFDDLHPDGTIIETRYPHVILAGDRPRGTLYAVYSFLEDVVGCRWWTSTASTIPYRPNLSFEERHDRFVPTLEYREPFWWDAFDGDWAVRNKSNANRARLDEQRGDKVKYGGAFFVHTFNFLASPATYFKDHPEWFSERGGKRIGGNGERTQLCLTNEELKRHVVDKVLKWIEDNPGANIISVSQNDWDNHCLCPKCKALEDKEGSPAGPLLHFVNYVAQEVGKKHPDIAIDTLAYQYTRKPPKHVKPLPNVIVRLCSIECNFLQPLTHWSNRTFRQDIEGWSKVCNRLYVWDYVTNFGHYIQPHPNLRVLGPNVRFFVEHGVKGLFEQGAYQSVGGEFAELKAWVLAKLLWEPYRDEEFLIDEFCNGYYGAAGPYIREYINYLHDDAISSGHYLSIGSSTSAPFLSLQLMAKAEELFNQAEEAVKGDAELLNRVQMARLPVRYVWTMRWHDLQDEAELAGLAWPGPADYAQNARTFMQVAKANKVTKLSEGRPIEAFSARTVDLGRRKATPPPGCEKLKVGQYIDLQDTAFRLWREGAGAMLAKDPTASDGVAAKMPGTHLEWAVQRPLSVAGLDEKAAYSVYVSIRCDKKGNTGPAFSYGLYDIENRVFSASHHVACESVKTPGYQTYKIFSGKLHRRMYLWAAPPKNPDNVDWVWVDRFWLVKED